MTNRTNLRDGENLSADMMQRIFAQLPNKYFTPGGIGTGYSPINIGEYNGASGADPNHFAIIADGTTMTLTMRPGWGTVQRDSGSSSFDAKSYGVVVDSPLTATVTANASGVTRNDTVCLRLDQSTPPDASGTNIISMTIIAGGGGGGVSNAPADGALYVPLAVVAVPNGATSISQGIVTDKRVGTILQAPQQYIFSGLVSAGTATSLTEFYTNNSVATPLFDYRMVVQMAGRAGFSNANNTLTLDIHDEGGASILQGQDVNLGILSQTTPLWEGVSFTGSKDYSAGQTCGFRLAYKVSTGNTYVLVAATVVITPR